MKGDTLKEMTKVLTAALLVALIATPAAAQSFDPDYYGEISKSYTGDYAPDYYKVDATPVLIATISGDEEFDEGEQRQLQVQLENVGEIGELRVQEENDPAKPGEIAAAEKEQELEKAGTTARSIIAVLEKTDPDAPFNVRGATQTGGTLQSGNALATPLGFTIDVHDDAEPGTYRVQLTTTYRYQDDVALEPDNESSSSTRMSIYKHFTTGVETHNLTVVVKDDARFTRTGYAGDLTQGSSGVVEVTYRNDGNEVATDAVAAIETGRPFDAVVAESYLGDLAPGEEATARFRVKPDTDTLEGRYALTSRIDYEDGDGDQVSSDAIRVPVTVGISDYEVVDTRATLGQGSTGVIEVDVKNTGHETAKDAVAHVSATDPFDSVIDDAYLGDLAPGETRTARFKLEVSGDAVEGDYSLVTTLRYEDEAGDMRYSDPLSAPVTVEQGGGGLVSAILGLLSTLLP